MANSVLNITDDEFEAKVLKSDKPVMVDFWAPWCGPCKAVGPTVEALGAEYGDKVNFFKVNVDDNPVSPSKYGVQAIPTLIFFKEGKISDQLVGMVGKEKLEEAINKLV